MIETLFKTFLNALIECYHEISGFHKFIEIRAKRISKNDNLPLRGNTQGKKEAFSSVAQNLKKKKEKEKLPLEIF